MLSKIFSFTSLIVSIAAFAVSGAFFVYRITNRLAVFPGLLLLVTTLTMVIICTFNYYHAIMSPDKEKSDDEKQNND